MLALPESTQNVISSFLTNRRGAPTLSQRTNRKFTLFSACDSIIHYPALLFVGQRVHITKFATNLKQCIVVRL